jgi:hypothetical protein
MLLRLLLLLLLLTSHLHVLLRCCHKDGIHLGMLSSCCCHQACIPASLGCMMVQLLMLYLALP